MNIHGGACEDPDPSFLSLRQEFGEESHGEWVTNVPPALFKEIGM